MPGVLGRPGARAGLGGRAGATVGDQGDRPRHRGDFRGARGSGAPPAPTRRNRAFVRLRARPGGACDVRLLSSERLAHCAVPLSPERGREAEPPGILRGMIMRTRISGEVRERLRQLVLARARVLGLTPAAVEMLIGTAALERWAS